MGVVNYLWVWHRLCGWLREFLEYVDCAGERREVVAALPVEEAWVGQSPHVLRLDLGTMETTLNQHPHKQGEEV